MGINSHRKKIIVIEDDKNINRLITYNLERVGFLVDSFYDGAEAEKRLSDNFYDIIILDIMLPGIDGFSLCKLVKDNFSYFKTSVIILSAKTDIQDKLYAHILGADYYLTKPFKVEQLIDIVKEISALKDQNFRVRVGT